MSESKVKSEAKTEELVEVYVPKGSPKDDPNLFVGINGKNWLLPKGKTSKVPAYVAEEYNRHLAAVESYTETISSIQESEKAVNAAAGAKIG